MENLKCHIRSYLALLSGKPLSENYCRNTLPGLPPELLLLIGDFLSWLDLVCLSLCNHRLYKIFKRYYQLRPSTENQKTLTAVRLGKDHPEYFACTICKKFHQYNDSVGFGLGELDSTIECRLPCVRRIQREKKSRLEVLSIMRKRNWLGPQSTFRTHRRHDYVLANLSFLHLKLAMRRFNYGPSFGISTESLSHTQVRKFVVCGYMSTPIVPKTEVLTLFSREAQICFNPLGLCVRTQDIVRGPQWPYLFFDERLQIYDTCIHNDPIENLSELPERMYYERLTSYSYLCEICNTASLIQTTWTPSDETFILTRWVNLGPGLNPEDPRWKIHVNSTSSRPTELPTALKAQNPRFCFEQTALQSYEDLFSQNDSYLKDNQYQNNELFIPAGEDTWYIPHKNS